MKVTPLLTFILTAALVPRPAAAQMPQAGSGVFLGGVPTGTATADVVKITVLDAIDRALAHNLGVLTAEQELGRAGGARWQSLSELLPNLNARVSETQQKLNLAAFGFGSGTVIPGFENAPTVVGPFNVFDARVFLTQSVFDLQKINDTRAQSHSLSAAQYTYQGARDFVIHVSATLYLQALAAAARADAARAQQTSAEALYHQAVDLKENGLIAGVDVLRAQVQLSTEMQRSTAATNDQAKAKLQLARVMGLPLGQAFELDPALPDVPTPDLTLDQAVEKAYASRPDYQAALERVRSAEAARQAIIGEALPSFRINADYGKIGLTVSDALSTYSVTGALNVPIFQGGKIQGKLQEADAEIRRRKTEAEDLKASIYYDIQGALLDLHATNEQLQVATTARELAAQQLVQARDRFAAGVTSNIEVVQAQEAVAVANEQQITAMYGYDLAKGALIRGVGAAEDTLRAVIGGAR